MSVDGVYKLARNNAAPLSVVVPVYRSATTLAELHKRLSSELSAIAERYEIILVEDCGGDNSWQVIQQLTATDPNTHGIRLSRNYGQHNALLCGIRAAKNEIILTLDDDLQNPPEEITKLVLKIDEGYDVVYGTPEKQQHGLFRNLASQITKFALQSAMGADTAGKVTAFRAFRSELRKAFGDYRSPHVNIDVLLTWATNRFDSVVVRHDPRASGQSGYDLRKLITHALNMVTGFSTKPLRLASVMGFAFAGFGFVVLAYVLVSYLLKGGSVPGFPFLASIIAIFSGAQMFALGIIGEYLARMHYRTMEQPPYAVRETSEYSAPE